MLWPGATQAQIESKFLLWLTDGVAYMLKAGKNLKSMYPDLLHITCLAHGVNLVAEEVRSHFLILDNLIGAVKAVFRKAPTRVLKYKEMNPELELPPQPTIIRWGTWLNTAEFYAKHFQEIKHVVESFNPNEAQCIKLAQELLNDEDLSNDIAYISANFSFLYFTLKKLQEKGERIYHVLESVDEIAKKLSECHGDIAKAIFSKYNNVIQKNVDLLKIRKIVKILNGESDNDDDTTLTLAPSKIAAFMFAPLTTCDVERSFSMEKELLSNRRRSLTAENLEMTLVSHFNLSK